MKEGRRWYMLGLNLLAGRPNLALTCLTVSENFFVLPYKVYKKGAAYHFPAASFKIVLHSSTVYTCQALLAC